MKRRIVLYMAIASFCAFLAGCSGAVSTVWASAKAVSPNGQIVASASTTDTDGSGINDVFTTVNLKFQNSAEPIAVLVFNNESAYPKGATAVELQWLSNSHLDVTYHAGASTTYQEVKTFGITITIHKAGSASHHG